MKKIKIGILTHNFPESASDRKNAGIFVYDLAKALLKKADIAVFSPGSVQEVKSTEGIKTHFFKFNSNLGSLKIYNPADLIKVINFFKSGKEALDNFINLNPDLDFIISMWAFPSGDFANYLYKKYKIPYAIYCLGSDIYIYGKKPFLKRLIKRYLTNAKAVFADSPDLARETEKLSGRNVSFVPSASNFPVTKKKPVHNKKTVITFLGRLEKVKGIDIFLVALGLLKNGFDKFEVNIIGGGSLEDYTKQKTGAWKNAKYWGNIANSTKIASIFAKSDWLVIPSRSDSIPLVFSEAMKSSLPVVAADLSDLKYLVDKYKVGLSFRRGDAEDLAKVLNKIITKKTDYLEYKKKIKEIAHKFDLEAISDIIMASVKKHI